MANLCANAVGTQAGVSLTPDQPKNTCQFKFLIDSSKYLYKMCPSPK